MPPETVASLVAAARSRIEQLTPEMLASEAQSGSRLIVDIREPEELRQTGVIPGAVFIRAG